MNLRPSSPSRRATWRALGPLALLFFAMAAGCATGPATLFYPPGVRVEAVEFRATGIDSLAIDLALRVENPNPFPISLGDYDLDVVVGGMALGAHPEPLLLEIPGGETMDVNLPISLAWNELAGRLARGVPDTLSFQVRGSAQAGAYRHKVPVAIYAEGELPVIMPPHLEARRLRVRRARRDQLELEIEVSVENPNGRPIAVRSLGRELSLDDRQVLASQGGDRVDVAARGLSFQTLGLLLQRDQVDPDTWLRLAGSEEIQVALGGRTEIDTGYGRVAMEFRSLSSLMVAQR